MMRKIKEFNAYVLWNSISEFTSEMSAERLGLIAFEEPYNGVLEVKTHTEFAKVFGVNIGTLREWRKHPKFENEIVQTVDRGIFLEYYARVVYSFTLKTIEEGDARRFEVWMQKFAGHIDKSTPEPIEEAEIILPEYGENLMSIVMDKISRSRGIPRDKLDEIIAEVTDPKPEGELHFSEQQYDFDKIKKIHEEKKAVKAAEAHQEEANLANAVEAAEELRAKLKAELVRVSKEGLKVVENKPSKKKIRLVSKKRI